MLRDSIEDLITRRWPGLGYALFVPCLTRAADGLRCRGQFPLKFLLGYREKGGTHTACHECFTSWDISELLTGFAQPELALQPELQRLQDQVADVQGQVADVASGVNRLESLAAQSADSMRRVLLAVGSEITDCPRLFTLTHETPTGARRWKFYQRHYRLILWCEHPGHEHPWPAASYSLDQPKDWLVRAGPYLSLIFTALRLVVPVAAPVTGVLLPARQFEQAQKWFEPAQQELEMMQTLLGDLPDQETGDPGELAVPKSQGELTPAEGQAARTIRVLLFEHDRMRAFGDLRRVQAPAGEFLWVCADYYPDYDPGLPSIPVSQS